MPTAEKSVRLAVRFDETTMRDLRRVQAYYRTSVSGALRIAVAELARRLRAEDQEAEGGAAA